MKRSDDTIGYAIKVGGEFEIRIVSVSGEQRRVNVGASEEFFANLEKISERIHAEKHLRAA